ncbi:Pantothenate synthetase [Geodia barretti]|uniref:Pantoate--beta-alanine ligase n=4 Tax=Geodia barretti TaxID=519541 RepID=A0AA35S4M9_GEOBA|nr:Pantothenate synthetase [Geodia barretti]
MKIIRTCAEMAALCRDVQRPLGLVPTMGALHDGHLSLTRRARADSATMAVSIFVNPTQFGAGEDFNSYPRSFERDLDLLAEQGTDLVFAPPPEEVYPDGFDTWIEPGSVTEGQEGEARPGHFKGVATVVAKLFSIVRADRAYFGQKDGQQVAVIRRMAQDLNLGVEVVTMPTIREADGLALSSRNAYLTTDQRQAAPVIYRALCAAQELWRGGEQDAGRLRAAAMAVLQAEPMLELVDYVSVVDADSMAPVERADTSGGRRVMVAVAAKLGQPRLIDNIILGDG